MAKRKQIKEEEAKITTPEPIKMTATPEDRKLIEEQIWLEIYLSTFHHGGSVLTARDNARFTVEAYRGLVKGQDFFYTSNALDNNPVAE